MTLKTLPNIHHEPADFEIYLRQALPHGREKARPVGRPSLSGDCPLSRWLSWLHKCAVTVTRDAIWIRSVGYIVPAWMIRFQDGADGRDGEITAKVALEVLALVVAEEQKSERKVA